ncbi:hypothetical protein [Psychromicrobium lacuslunae]|uniref:hypothetical protein n=1 Tax=Psychromicrobium lacuslunae TaxID=1618207 RepID=UPI0006985E06|nr:hypothetical protein [Psychromicrobium lacuslunae]
MSMDLINRSEIAPAGLFSRRLLKRWRSLSRRSHWRVPQDWWTPEVDSLLSGRRNHEMLSESARQLGAARCRQGVGVTEALTDFRCYFKAALRHTDLNAIQAFVEGWVSEAEEVEPISCTDPSTGLSTKAHFSKTLQEFTDRLDSAEALLATVTLIPRQEMTAPLSWTQVAALGAIFLAAFRDTESTLMYEGHTVYVLAVRTPELFSALLDCQAQITLSRELGDFRSTVACEALPQQSSGFHQVLKSLHR